MKVNRIFLIVVTGLLCVAFYFAGRANAANYNDTRLDAVATAIAGHPVTVTCADTTRDWVADEDAAHLTFEADGYTFVGGQPIIWLAPRVCATLEALLAHPAAQVGPYWVALAVKTILHESTHQSGVLDERTTDCKALAILPTWLPKFGIAAKVAQASYVKQKSGLYKRVTKTVTNPLFAQTISYAKYWHNLVPGFGGPC